MNLQNRKQRPAKTELVSFAQQEKRAGLLVTNELEKARAGCKVQVERIAKDCRAKNRRFRDVEFDLENDRQRCLFGLSKENREYRPSDVQRVTKIFGNPSFFVDGADSNDVIQGKLGDCWFLSALTTMTTAKGLLEKFCVACDEQVGIYGFLFFRDTAWVPVIIDDLLFTSIPKYEELTAAEKELYHRDKKFFNSSARKGGKSLYFARSGTEDETWLPLIEKAYAKLHGDYTAIDGGFSCEAMVTVNAANTAQDILDHDVFWREELLLATKDRLFGCGFDTLNSTRSGVQDITVNGLIGGHAYSVLRAAEYKGKRFVVVRNPWGDSEWHGAWSDGSREWTEEWLPALKELKHSFGNDGQFVMEYSDFLDNFDQVEKTLLFDDTWVMSSQWLQVTARPPSAAWSYGDVSFTITIPAPTHAVLVLSKLDERYFADISGNSCWMLEFVLFKKGSKEVVAESAPTRFYLRSANLEARLEAGEYVVHVCLSLLLCIGEARLTIHSTGSIRPGGERPVTGRFPMPLVESTVVNINFRAALHNLPIPLELLAGHDLTELETKAAEVEKQIKAAEVSEPSARIVGRTAQEEELQETTDEVITVAMKKRGQRGTQPKRDDASSNDSDYEGSDAGGSDDDEVDLDNLPTSIADEDLGLRSAAGSPVPAVQNERSRESDYRLERWATRPASESGYSNDTVVLGLRVYTHKDAPAVVGGQLRHEMKASLAALASSAL
ncbi:hypothetical protein B0H16DRAFT_1319778 [Mycena metata]|uniref:Calpain catalytic domain-containing protein n=1 Tax=Mycena metata TaxID=1033252 RepID=A0AAD7IRG5_9AGAR|nr:hypothetical protein B0H16DRAFT_1319778 [Mycena metata]